jgi:membrane associated rhomboid family serine protease
MLAEFRSRYRGTIALLLFLLSGFCFYPSLFSHSDGSPVREWWVPLVSMFMSANGWHLFGNALVVLMMGSTVERLVNTRFLLLLFFCCCFFGSLASAWLQPDSISLGCSAFCYGGLSFLLYLLWWAPELSSHLSAKKRSLHTFLLIYLMVLGCQPHRIAGVNADIVQHTTGVAVGLMLSFLLCKSRGKIQIRSIWRRNG